MRLEARQVPVMYPDGSKKDAEIMVPVREKDVCIIVGCATSKDIVPWNIENAEYWGVNNLYGVPLPGAHYDRWFEIHNVWWDNNRKCLVRRGLSDFRGQPVEAYMKGLATLGCPVYMQQFWPDLVPNSVPFPLHEVTAYFQNLGLSPHSSRYLTNTITIEIALAIMEGFKEIQIWGVDMAVGTEYQHQRPSCEFFLGIAAGMGIKIWIPDEADLLKCNFVYGFEEPKQKEYYNKINSMARTMDKKASDLRARIEADKTALNQYIGAIHATQEISKIWANLDDEAAKGKKL